MEEKQLQVIRSLDDDQLYRSLRLVHVTLQEEEKSVMARAG